MADIEAGKVDCIVVYKVDRLSRSLIDFAKIMDLLERHRVSFVSVSALDAAAQVLAQAGKPMRAQELIAAMAEQGWWTSPAGKTPHATLYAAMLREARGKGDQARFRKTDRGLFEYAG